MSETATTMDTENPSLTESQLNSPEYAEIQKIAFGFLASLDAYRTENDLSSEELMGMLDDAKEQISGGIDDATDAIHDEHEKQRLRNLKKKIEELFTLARWQFQAPLEEGED